MRILTIGFATAVVLSLCSFVVVQVQKKMPVDQKLYKQFLDKFDKAKMPYTLTYQRPKVRGEMYESKFKASDENTKKDKHLSHDFSKFIPAIRRGYMSRMGPDDYQAEVLVASNKEFNAIIYSRRPSHAGRKTSYILMTFDQYGDLIGKKEIASASGDSFTEAKISKKLEITTKEYKAIFDQNERYNDEQKVNLELEKSTKYTITASGEILKDGEATIKVKSELEQKASPEIGMSKFEQSLWEY